MTDRQAIADALTRLADLAERVEHVAPRIGLVLVAIWAITFLVWVSVKAQTLYAFRQSERLQQFRDGPGVQ